MSWIVLTCTIYADVPVDLRPLVIGHNVVNKERRQSPIAGLCSGEQLPLAPSPSCIIHSIIISLPFYRICLLQSFQFLFVLLYPFLHHFTACLLLLDCCPPRLFSFSIFPSRSSVSGLTVAGVTFSFLFNSSSCKLTGFIPTKGKEVVVAYYSHLRLPPPESKDLGIRVVSLLSPSLDFLHSQQT